MEEERLKNSGEAKMVSSAVVNTYPLQSYTFGSKEAKMEKDTSVADRLARMKVNYMKEGMRTSVEGILLVQEHNHPHILLLQIGNTFCKLPGGRLKPGENEIDGLKRKLSSKLAANSPGLEPDWKIGECVRPNGEEDINVTGQQALFQFSFTKPTGMKNRRFRVASVAGGLSRVIVVL
ncbi:unnamed protein product [Fraxinus pennsylvanica]|uniref:Pre-mRNA cleavage factor Im 25 kDa subunit n=1 Tax=Fraxinus pennsylvanica TaxID=56036 RepID=A0AAD1ZDR1_9LAMI|nr:unnamed protein product [Fraxinus pennsylvanica]